MIITYLFIVYLINSLVAVFSLILASITVSLGQGITASAGLACIERQPQAFNDIKRASLLATALMETGALLGFIIALFILFKATDNLYVAIAQIGMTIAIGLPSLVLGISSSFSTRSALLSITRQPFSSKKIINLLVFSQSLIQTPLIFGFIISLVIYFQLSLVTSLGQSLALVASGLSIGLGSIGAAYGGGVFTGAACRSLGLNKNIYSKMVSFTIISQVIIETPVILSVLLSFLLIKAASQPVELLQGIVYLAGSITMGLGALGSGIASGITASKSCEQIAFNPVEYNFISRLTIFAQTIIDTSSIYAFIISLLFILIPIRS